MAKSDRGRKSAPADTGNKYLNLVLFAAAVCAEAVLLTVFGVGQPVVGYTLVILTVCVAAMSLHSIGSVILGSVAGVISVFCGFSASVFSGPVIYKVLICLVPKICVAWVVSLVYRGLDRHIPSALNAFICMVLGLVLNACVCALILLTASLFGDISSGMDLPAVIRGIFRSLADLGISIKNVFIP